MQFFDDARLYESYGHFCRHFPYPAAAAPTKRRLLFHCYWTGRAREHQLLSIYSLIASQSRPREVWVWMPADALAANRDFASALENIPDVVIRTLSPADEFGTSRWAGQGTFLNQWNDASPRACSDLFRLLVLEKY